MVVSLPRRVFHQGTPKNRRSKPIARMPQHLGGHELERSRGHSEREKRSQFCGAFTVGWLRQYAPDAPRGESGAEPNRALLKQPPLRVEGGKLRLGRRLRETKVAIGRRDCLATTRGSNHEFA